jgi:hypothetical protein
MAARDIGGLRMERESGLEVCKSTRLMVDRGGWPKWDPHLKVVPCWPMEAPLGPLP